MKIRTWKDPPIAPCNSFAKHADMFRERVQRLNFVSEANLMQPASAVPLLAPASKNLFYFLPAGGSRHESSDISEGFRR
jgi:hypothetical protein